MTIKFDQCILLFALVWFCITAYFNVGYYHLDEHYQIIEFSQVADGKISGDKLAWEFNEKIRPSIQPVVCYLIFKACNFLTISDPFTQAFILRLITAVIAVTIIYLFTKSCKRFIPDTYWRPFLLLSYFLWFIPFLNIRFSSEAWSGIFLILSVIMALKENKGYKDFMLIGILSGLSFLFRFQIIFASAGLFLWLILIQRSRIRYTFPYILGFLFIVSAGVVLDSWFYGEFVITPWRYFKINILEDVASNFGTSPWYYYFYYIFRYSFFPFGIVILTSFMVFIYKKPLSVFTWVILPFLGIHLLIPHKELRFLFPLINFIPAVIIIALNEIDNKQKLVTKKSFKAVIYGFTFLNFLCLATSNLKPADRGRIGLAETINEIAQERPVELYYVGESNPFEPFKGLVTNFYLKPEITYKNFQNVQDINNASNSSSKELLVVMTKDLDKSELKNFIQKNDFRKVSQSIPEYFSPFLKLYGGYKMDEIVILYERGVTKTATIK